MDNNLYFIPIISNAVCQQNTKTALKTAFQKIIIWGQRPEYRQGFAQFKHFMATAYTASEKDIPWLKDVWDIQERETHIKLKITREGKHFDSVPLIQSENSLKIIRATPGSYSFQLSTGRMLWEGSLSQQDLLLLSAYPNRDLKLAADTDDSKPEATREIQLLDGEILVRTYPGIEHGIIEIKRLR